MKLLRSFVVVCLILLLICSCASKKRAIVGKWKEIGETEIMEFFADGTVTVADQGMYAGGNYEFIDDGRMKLDLGGIFALVGPMVCEVSVSKGELVFTMPDGETSKYQKLD